MATEGGRTIWLAGEGGTKDAKGNNISNNTPAQIEYIFGQFAETLKTYGGTTDDIVKMTVFIKDQADGTPFTHEICPYSNAIKASVDVKITTRS